MIRWRFSMIYVYKMKKKFQIYDITKIDHLSTFIEFAEKQKIWK